jgi:hypothetical protein
VENGRGSCATGVVVYSYWGEVSDAEAEVHCRCDDQRLPAKAH